ncbi:MAG: bifunctional phosphoserine phosphatase/homoserine phosphotransferase ThrH [Promethearchaeota archaeon]|nr:MAG: bifunctional phosphoserine phosphatase/homoserine phosphotransferase ThrH [Candidatus Lokiarchaeota archaeon]
MFIICFDLEGVFIPEIWINIALATGINELKLTTRDIDNFDLLMKNRLKILKEHKISLLHIQKIVKNVELIEGAKKFLDWIRSVAQIIIVSDSFIEFLWPIIKKLGFPLIMCHDLETDENHRITNYHLRIKDMKKKTILACKKLNYEIIAIGDSYKDIDMLLEAQYGILFRPPENIAKKYPTIPIIRDFSKLQERLANHLGLNY